MIVSSRSPDAIARRPLVWLNLVCLDAPLVAIAWQWLFARSFHLGTSTADRVALFLSAWLIYLSDRLFDSISRSAGTATTLRERFCSEHRRAWVGVLFAVALFDGIVIWRSIERETFRLGIVLATIVAIYLAVNAAFNRSWKTIPVKELAVGFLFAGGTLLAFMPSLPSRFHGFVWAASLFACLCSLNCMSIAVWEQQLDRIRGRHSIATRWPRMKRPVMIASIVLALASAVLPSCDTRLGPLSMCLATSFFLLALLHTSKAAAIDEQTALADLVLLTPGCFFLFERLL
jgi:hypothetical protein